MPRLPRRSLAACTLLGALLCAASLRVYAQLAPPPTVADSDEASESERRLIKTVRAQLVAEQFDEIDRTADALRRGKDHWTGGGWKLHTLYEALDAPHLTDKDFVDHLEHLRHWMTQRPESITARIALATSLHRWAWVARGNGTADKVTDEGWALFKQRIAESQVVLESARNMKVMCPQWYSEEMTVGLAQGWDARRMEDLYNRAVQFEPTWQYYYRARANYLLPKWYGEGSDATKFAKTAADRSRGDQGDWIYFEIAVTILHRGNGNLEPFVKALDWQRIQRGYHVLESQYGTSNGERNQLAFMAYKFNDSRTAQQQFASIGQDWARFVWKDRNFFDRVRDWSTGRTQWP